MKILIFGQKPWIIFFGKCRCFALFKSLIFWSKNHSFLSKRSKNDSVFTDLFYPKKKKEKVWFLDKNHGLSPLENLAVLHCLKIYFSGLKIIPFYLKYQKTILSDLIIPTNPNKKKFDFWTITEDYSLRKMPIFFDLLKL